MQGLRVVDQSRDIGGAYCARLLASCGADVTLVEPPEGEALRHQPPLPAVPGRTERVSARHEHLNAYKRGIVVDRSTVAGQRVLPWSMVRAVRFDRKSPWATLQLRNEDVVVVLAVQAVDRERAVRAVEGLRALLAAARALEPTPPPLLYPTRE